METNVNMQQPEAVRRRIDDLGRIIIPKEYRKELDIEDRDMLEERLVVLHSGPEKAILITPVKRTQTENLRRKLMLPMKRLQTFLPRKCLMTFITTDGTDILGFSHIGYAPSLMERSLFSCDEFERNIVPFLKKKYYDTPGLQVDRYIAQRGEWYFFFRIFSDTQLLGYVAIVTDDKKAFNDLTEALPSLEAGTQMMSCVLHDVSIQ